MQKFDLLYVGDIKILKSFTKKGLKCMLDKWMRIEGYYCYRSFDGVAKNFLRIYEGIYNVVENQIT
ncbi:hypothetical protein CHY_2632 [Carboxydothermus hydrogenoformans Z-2901]|uniref:Uncharacterized protein n=1 Tax=Carboxydothermus hydrogenoformans (strain ATCC BAA-161 / DSM 6008 / Z-2901) TaxID=246194 RepID=Q3A8W0_CARHZ|nr:hypothetical protein CHY_2632 [Carboxydothermus hydrogenoformans Z-2901]